MSFQADSLTRGNFGEPSVLAPLCYHTRQGLALPGCVRGPDIERAGGPALPASSQVTGNDEGWAGPKVGRGKILQVERG